MTAIANTTSKFAAMGKEELRAACRVAGISYGKLNNDGMRAALVAAEPVHIKITESVDAKDARLADAAREEEVIAGPNPFGALMGQTFTPAATEGTKVVDGKKVDPKAERAKSEARDRSDKAAPVVPRVSRKGYKIQQDREQRNGVKRPSEGTVCGAVWSAFDTMHGSATGLKAADLPDLADENGWNRTNVSCEYYAWRKFNGIVGRAAK